MEAATAWGGGLGFMRGLEDEIWVDERKRCELFVLVGLQKLLRYPYCVCVMCSLSVGITVNSYPKFLFLPPVEANRRRDEWNWRENYDGALTAWDEEHINTSFVTF